MNRQMSLSAISDELAQVRTRKKEFLAWIEQIIPLGEWTALIQPYYYKGERGNKPYPLEVMLRLYVLHNLYDLSDEANALADFTTSPSSSAERRTHNMMRKNLIQRIRMPLPALEQYYRERRKDRFENNEPFGGVKLRKALHPMLVCGLKIMHLISGQKITVIGDRRIPTERPIIFAATHIGWDDIEMIFTAIGTHAYLFWGDPRESYRTMDGFLLDLNGTIICDTDNKNDRYFGKETCIRWLKQGGNLLIFPEGAWNTTESLPTMPLYAGTAEMAIRSGAEIVPVAIEQYGKHYTVNIGENMRCSQMELAQKLELTAALRDAMATLRWEIWSRHPQTKRAEIPPDYRQKELRRIQDQMNGVYILDDIEKTRFHTKEEREQKDAFACLDRLIPCWENAFLFRDNNIEGRSMEQEKSRMGK